MAGTGGTDDDAVKNAASSDRSAKLGITYNRYLKQILFRDEEQLINGATEPFVTMRGGESELEESIRSKFLGR